MPWNNNWPLTTAINTWTNTLSGAITDLVEATRERYRVTLNTDPILYYQGNSTSVQIMSLETMANVEGAITEMFDNFIFSSNTFNIVSQELNEFPVFNRETAANELGGFINSGINSSVDASYIKSGGPSYYPARNNEDYVIGSWYWTGSTWAIAESGQTFQIDPRKFDEFLSPDYSDFFPDYRYPVYAFTKYTPEVKYYPVGEAGNNFNIKITGEVIDHTDYPIHDTFVFTSDVVPHASEEQIRTTETETILIASNTNSAPLTKMFAFIPYATFIADNTNNSPNTIGDVIQIEYSVDNESYRPPVYRHAENPGINDYDWITIPDNFDLNFLVKWMNSLHNILNKMLYTKNITTFAWTRQGEDLTYIGFAASAVALSNAQSDAIDNITEYSPGDGDCFFRTTNFVTDGGAAIDYQAEIRSHSAYPQVTFTSGAFRDTFSRDVDIYIDANTPSDCSTAYIPSGFNMIDNNWQIYHTISNWSNTTTQFGPIVGYGTNAVSTIQAQVAWPKVPDSGDCNEGNYYVTRNEIVPNGFTLEKWDWEYQ